MKTGKQCDDNSKKQIEGEKKRDHSVNINEQGIRTIISSQAISGA